MHLTPLTTTTWQDYELLDSGDGRKLERFGSYILSRPEPQALWRPSLSEQQWQSQAHATFVKEKGSPDRGTWQLKPGMAEQWSVGYPLGGRSLRMRLGLTAFKHVGLFPEQAVNWDFIYDSCQRIGPGARVLNLFAYTGGASLAAALSGADVTHVDSVKQTVSWSKENMLSSGLDNIRWVVEDALKFVQRQVKRGAKYDGIILDPPAYGRGANGEKWVLESDILQMLTLCRELLEPTNAFLVLNLYSMGLSATLSNTLVDQLFPAAGLGCEPDRARGCGPDTDQRPDSTASLRNSGEIYIADSFGKKLPLGVVTRFFIKRPL